MTYEELKEETEKRGGLMTNNEAIEVLRANYPDACFGQLREAVDMAIAALTRQIENTTQDAAQMSLSSAQPKRMRAKWIVTTSLQEGQITWRDYKCSNCSHHRGKPMNFCEVCGAKMER